jgi:hypothetical protein
MGVQTGVAIAARRFEGVDPLLQGAHLFKRVIHACLYTPEQGSPRPLTRDQDFKALWPSSAAAPIRARHYMLKPSLRLQETLQVGLIETTNMSFRSQQPPRAERQGHGCTNRRREGRC